MFVNTHLWPSHYERRKESLFVQVIMCFHLLAAKCLPTHEKKILYLPRCLLVNMPPITAAIVL